MWGQTFNLVGPPPPLPRKFFAAVRLHVARLHGETARATVEWQETNSLWYWLPQNSKAPKATMLHPFEIWALSGTWVALGPTMRTEALVTQKQTVHIACLDMVWLYSYLKLAMFGCVGSFEELNWMCKWYSDVQEDYRTLVEFANRPWAFNVDCKAQCLERTFEGAEKKPPVKLLIFDFDGALTLYTFMPEDLVCRRLNGSSMFLSLQCLIWFMWEALQLWKDPRCSTDLKFTPNDSVKQRYVSGLHCVIVGIILRLPQARSRSRSPSRSRSLSLYVSMCYSQIRVEDWFRRLLAFGVSIFRCSTTLRRHTWKGAGWTNWSACSTAWQMTLTLARGTIRTALDSCFSFIPE